MCLPMRIFAMASKVYMHTGTCLVHFSNKFFGQGPMFAKLKKQVQELITKGC